MELSGHCCSIMNEEGEYLTGSADIVCEVLDVDDEWIKISYQDKIGRRVVKLERIEYIDRVEIFSS
jgi:hypothetical protein